jgi:hypothetical protein
MEAKETQTDSSTIDSEGVPEVHDGYVSPYVLAALAGEQVEFGKTVPTQEDLDNNAD